MTNDCLTAVAPNRRPIRHPATTRLFQTSAARFLALKRQHARACEAMWAGLLASHFTRAEVTLLDDYLSPHDHALLAAARTCHD